MEIRYISPQRHRGHRVLLSFLSFAGSDRHHTRTNGKTINLEDSLCTQCLGGELEVSGFRHVIRPNTLAQITIKNLCVLCVSVVKQRFQVSGVWFQPYDTRKHEGRNNYLKPLCPPCLCGETMFPLSPAWPRNPRPDSISDRGLCCRVFPSPEGPRPFFEGNRYYQR